TNFHGLGNETPNITKDKDYYRMRTEEGMANLGLGLTAGKNNIRITGFYQRVKIINDSGRYVHKNISGNSPGIYTPDNYAGLQIAYGFADVKDSVLPQKGITFLLGIKHTQNLEDNDRSFQTYTGNVQFFIPVIPKLSLAIKAGGATITGKPMFYQYPSIGESYDLRAFRRERFSGKTTFYNNTELRFIKNVRSYIFNGKAGLIAFVDNGRVWMPGEKSDKFHTSFGGGILIAPFNMMSAAITYGASKELRMLQLRVGMLF
ncbi:MAG TPA: BamA/TamA family outer membrane protein, partial [Ferruginibacter sp.]|nr:BamA/TamA family outer membrane protein [Ferruginibacter sp.]